MKHLLLINNAFNSKGIIIPTSNLFFSAKTYQSSFPIIKILSNQINKKQKNITINIRNRFIEKYKTQNIAGFIQGKSDSTIILVSHYDHVGKLGTHIYPGALDNASGVAMLLAITRFLQKNKPKYNTILLFVSGEECGLQGSNYFVEHDFPYSNKIKQVINFDMIGSGEGAGELFIFNGKENNSFISRISKLNEQFQCINKFNSCAVTTGSDHASFYKKGYPSVGFLTDGDFSNYHTPSDKLEKMTLKSFFGIFKLIILYLST